MIVIRNFVIHSGGLSYAGVLLKWSPTCNTVWTEAVNYTGKGAGYPPAQSLTSDEKITVYNCPKDACATRTETETGDVLPTTNSTGWSHQFVIPPNGSAGSPAAPQPPSMRGMVTIHFGGSVVSLDTAMEPTWTWYQNYFKNERILRNDMTVMNCANPANRCVTSLSPVFYHLDSSLDLTTGVADLKLDMENTILPGWNNVAGVGPTLHYCTSGCVAEDVIVKAVPLGNTDLGTANSVTLYDGGFSPGTPAHYLHRTMLFKIKSYDHSCVPGCTGGSADDRILLGHEMGHTLGLEHCDTNGGASVMCAARSTTTDENVFDGTHYWLPRLWDVRAFASFY